MDMRTKRERIVASKAEERKGLEAAQKKNRAPGKETGIVAAINNLANLEEESSSAVPLKAAPSVEAAPPQEEEKSLASSPPAARGRRQNARRVRSARSPKTRRCRSRAEPRHS